MKYKIAGKILTCQHCGNQNFEESKAQLNTSAMTFFDLDWLNRSSKIYICSDCGRIEWFTSTVESFEDKMESDSDCLACDGIIPAGSDTCTSCVWSYNVASDI